MLTKYIKISVLLVSISHYANALDSKEYDYFSNNRQLVRNGVQALLTCNGLFTSNRSLNDVFKYELAYLKSDRFGGIVGSIDKGEWNADKTHKTVSVGGINSGPEVTAVFREGIGCIVMSPNQSLDEIQNLPELRLPYPNNDPKEILWPNGDKIPQYSLPSNINKKLLNKATTWAFNRPTPEQKTLSLIVLHKGNIILEKYSEGVDLHTKTRTWSTAKSIAVTLIGILVDQELLSLDNPLNFKWKPELSNPENDPRNKITLRHVLNMSSGLYPVDSFNMEYATGSGLAYWAGASSITGMRDRGLVRNPGTFWEYENYDTLLAIFAMKKSLKDTKTYLEFPRKSLLDKIGMRNTFLSTDRFGDFILSSQVYTNARDLARFGLLYLQNGIWNKEQIISEDWIDFVRTPAPSTQHRGNFYGGQWWLVPDDRIDVPKDAYTTAGNRGQYVIVVPSYDLVIVRRGLDWGKQGFDEWDLTREIIKSFQ